MKKLPTIEDLTWRLMQFAMSECDAVTLIQEAWAMCENRPDPRSDAAAVLANYISVGPNYISVVECGWCGKEFRPTPQASLVASARLYIDYFLDDCKKSIDPFFKCKACGGKLPFQSEATDDSQGETR